MGDESRQLVKAIGAYASVAKKFASTWDLECLLQSFEASFIQNFKTSKYAFYKALIYNSMYQQVPKIENTDSAIYFWPFQFHHCDFMVPVIKRLREAGKLVRVLVFRSNLIPYLQELGIEAELLTFEKKPMSLSSIVYALRSGMRYQRLVSKSKQSDKWKNGALNVFQDLSSAVRARSAANCVAGFGGIQYHVLGHDMALQGRAISNVMKKCENSTTARIQNGAVNYILCSYSKIDEVFFWDSLSKKAYSNAGWKGESHVVGNIKLWQKVSDGMSSGWNNWLENYKYQKRVLVAFSGAGHKTTDKGHRASLTFLEKLVHVLPGVGFIVKLHPKDQIERYLKLRQCENVIVTADLQEQQKPDALDALLSCQALITGGSSVALDALSLHIPVISIDPFGEMAQFGFLKEPSVTRWMKLSQLDSIAKQVEDIQEKSKALNARMEPVGEIANIVLDKLIE